MTGDDFTELLHEFCNTQGFLQRPVEGGHPMSEIKPAMTAEQWAEFLTSGEVLLGKDPVHDDTAWADGAMAGASHYYGATSGAAPRNLLAALALHGQPFGFTWDDVDLLRMLAAYWDERVTTYIDGMRPDHARESGRRRDQLRSLADRIAALLPPREP